MGVLEQNYNAAMEKPLRVLEIFNEFFGEDRVDMQGFPTLADIESVLSDSASEVEIKNYLVQSAPGFILVHFPHVRITNEYDKYVDIKHLYAKVVVDIEGRIVGRFSLNRSEYTVLHFTNNYMHSHISCIPTVMTDFQLPCTGRGPINNTICSLSRDFDADLWRLFCLELDRFTQVESIEGTPYHRLESLINGGTRRSRRVYESIRFSGKLETYDLGRGGVRFITVPQLAEFIKYVIDSNELKFTYQNKGYYLAMSPCEYYIKVSNLFIKWYNKKYKAGEVSTRLRDLVDYGMLVSVIFVNNALMKEGENTRDYRIYQGAKVCTFKGREVRLVISDAAREDNETNNKVLLLRRNLAEYIITKILNVINFRYGNNKQQGDSTSSERVFYI